MMKTSEWHSSINVVFHSDSQAVSPVGKVKWKITNSTEEAMWDKSQAFA